MRILHLTFALLAALAAGLAQADGASSGAGYRGGSSAFQTAAALVKSERFDQAIPRLQRLTLDEPKNADVFNLLGFSLRKTGDLDNAGVAYAQALSLEPRHLGALEYQGELFLMRGEVGKAEANLRRIDSICVFGCDEERDLEAAIRDWRAKNGA